MKNKLLLIAILAITTQIQANAAITVEQSTNPAYLKNNGFSAQTTDMVNISKARAAGTEYYTKDEERYRNHNFLVKFIRKFYVYTDPAAEDYSFYHHDTKTTPSYQDL